jgi:hypothetical protein
MLISFVQGIVGSFDKHFCPFHEAGGEECRDHAEKDLLKKSGLHTIIDSTHDASGWRNLPETPLPSFHDP